MAEKIDTRLIAWPSAEGAAYVVKDGELVPALEHETWKMTLEDDSVITKEVVTWISQG